MNLNKVATALRDLADAIEEGTVTATQQPVAQQPVAQQPVAQQPVAQQPVAASNVANMFAPQAAQQPAPVPAAQPVPAIGAVVAALQALQGRQGPDAINGEGGILQQFEIGRLSDATPDRYQSIIDAANAR